MDVFKLQKMNSLAGELKKHNFAGTNDEAYEQAEEVYMEAEKEQEVASTGQVIVQKVDNLAEKRIELMLESTNTKYEQELHLLRSALGNMSQELETLKTEVKRLTETNPKQKEKQEALKTETKEAHPRQGNFTSEDVDIKKMFYFGAKKF